MRPHLCYLFLILLTVIFNHTSYAAVVIVDSFNEGGIDLEFGGPHSDFDNLNSHPLSERRVFATVSGPWTARQFSETGVMTFSTQLRGTPMASDFLTLDYSPEESLFSLLGFEGIVISVSNLSGSGELAAFVNASVDLAVRIPITGTGDLVYPVFLLDHGFPLEDLYALQFRIYPRTADFSITLDQITLVPEPGLSALIALAGGFVFFRRHRLWHERLQTDKQAPHSLG